ncbi:MAG TPA: (2Fe-2S)-binding protein [Candidatus Binatus sp.]|jgi:carbon-monoxide dehydrogenase small subunit|nr:(2Fe-2S)-binding protein [Candidatus Binatus sp.]
MTDFRASQAQSDISLTVNGEPRKIRAYPMERLLDVLRLKLGFTGAKEGCGEGECGSCSVLMDGALVNSCLIPVLQAAGASIVTIEGLAAGESLHLLQETFLECGGAQCGICTPGMILAAAHLLNRRPEPTADEIREGLSGNLCRCTGYSQIIEAVSEAARRRPEPRTTTGTTGLII